MTAPTTMQIPGFRGDVIAPDHDGYDDARAVWNGTVDRRPRLIARCSGTADVAAAVRFARDRDLEIAVRGGGHNVAGTAVCDDGIVIDLSAMRAVSVDPVERTALVQGGALWGDVDHETQAHGLATTGGIVGHTGVGGLSLGGGIGWLMRKHGLTVDNLVEAEVVTAEGDIIRASANDHPDLFWALRGGGGNFGVVSSFRFTLHPVGPTVMAGPVFWAAEDTTDVLRFYREFVTDAPDELGNVVRLGTIPPLPVVSEELHFRPAIAVASCYAGPVEDGERAVRALREFGTPLVDLVGPTLYVDHQSGIDDTVPHGWHYYWKATNLTGLSDEVIDIVAEHAYGATSPRSYAAMFHMGGAVARAPRDATAYPGRDVEHNIIIDAAWLPEQDDTVGAAETAWARGFLAALQPHRAGVYVNFLDSDDDTSRVREAYGDDTYRRLAEVKAKYDPENVFHNNKNIQPSTPAVSIRCIDTTTNCDSHRRGDGRSALHGVDGGLDEGGHLVGVRDHRDVARVHLDGGGAHPLGELPLGIGRDDLVVLGDGEPCRQRLPGRRRHHVVQCRVGQRLLDGAHHAGLDRVDVRSEMLQEGVLRQPGEALLVDRQVRDRRRRRALAEQRADRLALVEAEPRDVHQADDVRCVRSERGDDLTAVGVRRDQRRLSLQRQDVAQLGDVVRQRRVRELGAITS